MGPRVARGDRLPYLAVPCRHKASINPAAVRRLNTTTDERHSGATGAGPPIKSNAGHVGTIEDQGMAVVPLMRLLVGGQCRRSRPLHHRGPSSAPGAVTREVRASVEPMDTTEPQWGAQRDMATSALGDVGSPLPVTPLIRIPGEARSFQMRLPA